MLHGQSIVLHADSPVAIEPGGLVSVSSGSACGLDILSLSSLWLQVCGSGFPGTLLEFTFWRHSRACCDSLSLSQTPLLMTETWLGHWPAGF